MIVEQQYYELQLRLNVIEASDKVLIWPLIAVVFG